jgi:hypothetical protein
VGVALVTASPAVANSYRVLRADEVFRIQPNGTVLATEHLTFAFDGSFHGAYRLIPVAGLESIDRLQVGEKGQSYEDGADARVGSSGDPGTYGVTANVDGWPQVTWHFDAKDTARTFDVSYRMQQFVDAYDDVGNLYLQVWGNQWPVRLDRLHAEVIFPSAATGAEARLVRVWGHPKLVKGSTHIDGRDRVSIDATGVPSRTYVEIDTTFPQRMLGSDGSFTVHTGDGLPVVLAREKRIFTSPYGAGAGPAAVPSSGGGSGLWHWLWLIAGIPLLVVAGLFGLTRSGSDDAASGSGGSLGGGSGGESGEGRGGGGGGAW